MKEFTEINTDLEFEFGHLAFALKALAFVVFVATGISLTSTPDFETIFNTTRLVSKLSSSECIGIYTVTLGNTGISDQPYVDVTFRNEDIASTLMPLKVLKTGVILRETKARKTEDETVYRINDLGKNRWVTFEFSLKAECNLLPEPKELGVVVVPARGAVHQGDPHLSRLARLLFIWI